MGITLKQLSDTVQKVKTYVNDKTNFKLIKTISANTTSLTESFDDLFNNKGYSEVILVDYAPYGIMKRYTFDGYSATSENIEFRFTTAGAITTSVSAINSISLRSTNRTSTISVFEVNYAFSEDGTPNIKKTDGVSRDIYIYAR